MIVPGLAISIGDVDAENLNKFVLFESVAKRVEGVNSLVGDAKKKLNAALKKYIGDINEGIQELANKDPIMQQEKIDIDAVINAAIAAKAEQDAAKLKAKEKLDARNVRRLTELRAETATESAKLKEKEDAMIKLNAAKSIKAKTETVKASAE